MPFKHDFSHLSDYELENQYENLTSDLDGGKTYWYTDEVGRDHRRWTQMRAEIKRRKEDGNQ